MVDEVLGPDQFAKGDKSVASRLFGQFHSKITPESRSEIVAELIKQNPRIRLVLSTVALGMGLDAPSIRRIVHIRPPSTLMQYFQETGRAGRDGSASTALLYFNKEDICSSSKVDESVRKFCKSNTCLRRQLLTYFGYDIPVHQKYVKCCSNCHEE